MESVEVIELGTKKQRKARFPETIELAVEIRYFDSTDEIRMRRYNSLWRWLLWDIADDKYAA